ncbi:30S ribosomal protein S4e [mine drainage metagenome]|uniref:30S ribosomal protein S4e n=1 Tax=mine drainage metagenome TaxID=410659 RepID=T1CIH5_9ZZZZ
MAIKGNSRHIKRLNAPQYFGIERKAGKYVIKASPGRHTKEKGIALALFAKKAGLASRTGEAIKVIKSGALLVNGKAIADPAFPVGLSDMISAKDAGKEFVIGIDKYGKVALRGAEKGSALVYKVVRKYKASKGSIMISLHDGRILKGTNDIKANDSVKLNSDGKGIANVLKLKEGSRCMIIDGVHVGSVGTIKKINQGTMHSKKTVMVEGEEGSPFETLVRNIMVVE